MEALKHHRKECGPVFCIGLGPIKPWIFVTDPAYVDAFYSSSKDCTRILDFTEGIKSAVPSLISGAKAYENRNWFGQSKTLIRHSVGQKAESLSYYSDWTEKATLQFLNERIGLSQQCSNDTNTEGKNGSLRGIDVDLFTTGNNLLFFVNIWIVFGPTQGSKGNLYDLLAELGNTSNSAGVNPISVLFPNLPFGPSKLAMTSRKTVIETVKEELIRRMNCNDDEKRGQDVIDVLLSNFYVKQEEQTKTTFEEGEPLAGGELSSDDTTISPSEKNRIASSDKENTSRPRIRLEDVPVEDFANTISNFLLSSQTSSGHLLEWMIFHLCQRIDLVHKYIIPTDVDPMLVTRFMEGCLREVVARYGNVFNLRKTTEDFILHPGNNSETTVDGVASNLPSFKLLKDHMIMYTGNFCTNEHDKLKEFDPEASMKLEQVERGLESRYGRGFQVFGKGSHPCLGQHLVRVEFLAVIKTIFRNFDIKLVTDPDIVKIHFGTSIANPLPKEKVVVFITPRNDSLRC